MDIEPGATVSIEITAIPRSAAALKTLNRVCAKDAAVAKVHRLMKEKRPSWQDWIRGGKYWHHQMKTKPAAKLATGKVYTVHASLDVLRDLGSVKNCVKVTKQ